MSQAFSELIAKDSFPTFILFIDIDPKRIDINVHPTKQEIKFEDDRIIYSFVSSAVKHALSKYSIAPSLDFSLDENIERLSAVTQPLTAQTQERTKGDFLFQSFTEKGQAHFLNKKEDVRNWKDLYKIQHEFPYNAAQQQNTEVETKSEISMPDAVVIEDFRQDYLQVCQAYIIATTKNGFLLIDQHLAHQRILYERYESAQQQPIVIQKCLVPITFEVSPVDAVLLESILPSLLELGYEVEFFGQQTFIIQGTPSDIKLGNEKSSIEKLIDAYKHFASDVKLDKREKLMRTMAAQKAIWHGKKLEQSEIERLLQDLFRCEQPQLSPNGNKIFSKIQADDIERLIRNA